MTIHSTAIIDKKAQLAADVSVGAYVVIEGNVTIGAGTVLASHVRISGICEIGTDNFIDSFAAIGGAPQDHGYKGEPTKVIIGDNNQIREHVSIHRGTVEGDGKTVIGNNTMMMANTHLAHDGFLGDFVVVVNGAQLGGHTKVASHATIGGLCASHQFTRIGAYAFVGGKSAIIKDIPPYAMAVGGRGDMKISGLNKIGLRRNGFNLETIKKINAAYRILFYSDLLHNDALARVEQEFCGIPEVDELVKFIRESKRGVVKNT